MIRNRIARYVNLNVSPAFKPLNSAFYAKVNLIYSFTYNS